MTPQLFVSKSFTKSGKFRYELIGKFRLFVYRVGGTQVDSVPDVAYIVPNLYFDERVSTEKLLP